MENPTPELTIAVANVIDAIQRLNAKKPLFVALDGGSGAGKSTLALLLAKALNSVLIQSDDFYAAHISHDEWEARTPQQRASDVIDWRRLRGEVLEALLAGQAVKWHAFDFETVHPDGTYAMRMDYVERQPADVILLEGAYSARPELADLITLSVLVDVPVSVRHERLSKRENNDFLASWHARWDAAEAYYFTQVRPKSSFDLVVTF